jgi:hypothetical protein
MHSLGASLVTFASVLATPLVAHAAKTALVFNGGGSTSNEILKDESMVAESQEAIKRLQAAGYRVEDNVFLRDGPDLGSVQAREANGAAFLARVREVCGKAQRGDDLVIALGGHGTPDDQASGPEAVLQTRAVGYGYDNPATSEQVSPALLQAVDAYLRAHLAAGRAMAALNEESHDDQSLPTGTVRDELERIHNAENQAREAMAKELGVDPRQAANLFFEAQNRYDLLSVTPATRELAGYLLERARNPSITEERRAPQEANAAGVTVEDLGKALASCKRKGARVRIVATQCYSGAFTRLGDDEGQVCVVSLTGAYSTSSAFDLWRSESKAQSLDEIAKTSRNKEDSDSNKDKKNNEPQDSAELSISNWIDTLRAECSNEGSRIDCIDPANQAELCKALGPQAPPYFKRNAERFEQGAAPAALSALLGSKAAPASEEAEAARVNPGLEELLLGFGSSSSQIQSKADAERLAAQIMERAARDKAYAKKLKPVFMISSSISPAGDIDPAVRVGLTGYITQIIASTITWRSANGLEKNLDVIRHRKETYRKAFERFARGSCLKRYQAARSCLEAPLSDSASGPSPSPGSRPGAEAEANKH